MQSTNSLKQFFGDYFHQDCLLDDPSWMTIVLRYRVESGAAVARAIADEIRVLISGAHSEETLESFLFDELGCYYTPRPDLGGPRVSEWLASLSTELAK